METELTIHQVAELTGLSIDTLRYYERIRLLEPIRRTSSGHRRYRQTDIDWIGLLINLRETSMPLAQILHFAELRRQGDTTARERLALLEQHQHALEHQMQKLALHLTALQQKIAHKKVFLAQRESISQSLHTPEDTKAPVDSFDAGTYISQNKRGKKENPDGEE